jgi:hypothetical protein
MLSGIDLNNSSQVEIAKSDIRNYFETFGKISSVTFSNEASSNTPVVTIQFEDAASAIIARGYASGLRYYENVIDLEFVPSK